MDYAETRELVRLRYELRGFLAGGAESLDPASARALIARIEVLVSSDAEESAVVRPELVRWQLSLALTP